MVRREFLTMILAIAFALPAQAAPDALTAKQALRELTILERGLTQLHPGLTRYQPAPALAAQFEQARQEVAHGATPAQMYLLATRISASLRCGHTWTNPLNQSEAMKAALAQLPALPFHVQMIQRRMLVTASNDDAVAEQDEVLSVDGRPIEALIAALMPYLRADGSSEGKRVVQLSHNAEGGALDRLLPLLHPPQEGRYSLRLRNPKGQVREVIVAGQPATQRDAALAAAGHAPEDMTWRLDIHGGVAVMTLPTFSFWNHEFDWKHFLDDAFARLQREHVSRLILDVRQNEGGDAEVERALVGHLIDSPYTLPSGRLRYAYERAPYELARYLDTWDFGFFDRTGKVQRSDGGHFEPRDPVATARIVPQSPIFHGKVFALIGPRMSSAGFLLARDLNATHAAILIGEPTGGNRRGLNGGELAWLTLPYSGVAVDIPLQATVYEDQPDAGIVPDFLVAPTIEDVLAGRDAAMRRAMRR